MPSCPTWLAPQQKIESSASSTQAWLPAAYSATTSRSRPLTVVGGETGSAGLGGFDSKPCPCSPISFEPQHWTAPVVNSAQLNDEPTASVRAGPASPRTATAAVRVVRVPSPSWP